MPDDTADDDLAARVDALEDAVDDLRAARADARPTRRDARRGPFSVPRPPTPRELVRFAVDNAIPATVALLDAQKRALEALHAALRLVEPGHTGDENGDASVGRETLDRLDAALTDLRAAVSGDALPADDAARALLKDARALTADLEAEVAAARESRDARGVRESTDIAVADDTEGSGNHVSAAHDADERERRTERVEDELDQLRDEYDDGGDNDDSDSGGKDDADDENDDAGV